MRTRGILLVRDATLLLAVLPTDGECYESISSARSSRNLTLPVLGARHGLWRRSCDQILASLEEFSQNLLDNVKRFREYGDENGADVLSSSCIACLAHLAILYEVTCRTGPVAGEIYALCDSALQRLGMLTSELHLEEYTYLDLLLGVSPTSRYILTTVAQMGDRGRIPGGNHCQSSTPV